MKHEVRDQCQNERNSCKGERTGQVQHVISQLPLPLRKASGKDGISNEMIKNLPKLLYLRPSNKYFVIMFYNLGHIISGLFTISA